MEPVARKTYFSSFEDFSAPRGLGFRLQFGAAVGLIGGLASGLLGVSPGGILVPITILVLGCEQHVAQGISLFAQIPPTGLAGIKRYREHGNAIPVRWLAPLAMGFVAGGTLGAGAAGMGSSSGLRWSYVVYLTVLEILLLARNPLKSSDESQGHGITSELRWLPLSLVGSIAGFSSGFMGIGGGLATTVGLSGILKVPQHQAQAVSLGLSLMPLTIPAAWVYWRHGWSMPWTAIAFLVLGLWVGTDIGARAANSLREIALRRILAILIFVFAIYMGYKSVT